MPHTLPYAPDDDIAARRHVADELRHPNLARWRTMCSDLYLLQTYRVLCALDRDIDAHFARRRADLAATQAAYHARDISEDQRANQRAGFERWRANALTFRNKIHDRRDQLGPHVRRLRGDTGYQHLRESYLTLAAAVAHHRTAITTTPGHRGGCAGGDCGGGDCGVHDRLLWTLLDTLTIPAARTAPEDKLRLIPLVNALNRDKADRDRADHPPHPPP